MEDEFSKMDQDEFLRTAFVIYDMTPDQEKELLEDKPRAVAWFQWARLDRERKRSHIIRRFRSRRMPPNEVSWYAEAETMSEEEKLRLRAPKKEPDYETTVRLCESLVRTVGHEMLDEGLLAEFERIAASPYQGAGAKLSQEDVDRLLVIAAEMRK